MAKCKSKQFINTNKNRKKQQYDLFETIKKSKIHID